MMIELDKLVDYIQPGKYIVFSEDYSNEYSTPVLTAGKTFLLGYTNEKDGIFNASPGKEVILFDDFTTASKFVNFSFKVKSSACKILKPKPGVDIKYIFYAMQRVNIDIGLHKRYWISTFSKQKIYYPHKTIRNNFVYLLDSLNSLIDSYQKQNVLIEELIKSRFIEIFGDPQSSNLKRTKINEIGKCVSGATPDTSKSEYWNNGTIPWLTSGEVGAGRIFNTERKITLIGYNNSSTKLIPPHTLVIALAGQGKTRATVGIAEIKLCTNQSVCSILTKPGISVEYLYYCLKYQYNQLRSISNGEGGRGGLNLTILGNFSVFLPNSTLQKEFEDFVNVTERLIKNNEEQINLLKELLNQKMDEYFGGNSNA